MLYYTNMNNIYMVYGIMHLRCPLVGAGGGWGGGGVIDFGMRGGWSSFSIRRHKGKNKL